MPPKAKITRDMVIDAAFEVARKTGAENINARTVSKKLNCSTQPVMYHFATIEESIADLKNPNKDCSYTPDLLLSELDSFINKFHKEIAWYSDPFCTVVFPDISPVQLDYLKMRFGTISTAIHDLLKGIKRSMRK